MSDWQKNLSLEEARKSSPSPVRIKIALDQELPTLQNNSKSDTIITNNNNSSINHLTSANDALTPDSDKTNTSKEQKQSHSPVKPIKTGGNSLSNQPIFHGNIKKSYQRQVSEENISMILEQENFMNNVMLHTVVEDNKIKQHNNLTRQRMCVCDPNSLGLRIWDFILGLFLVVNFVLAVVVLAFSDLMFPGWGLATYSIIRNVVHIIDIVINSRVAFYVPTSSIIVDKSAVGDKIITTVKLDRQNDDDVEKDEKRFSFLLPKSIFNKKKSMSFDTKEKKRQSWASGGSFTQHSQHIPQGRDMSGFVLITDYWEMMLEYKSHGWLFIDLFIALVPSELIYFLLFFDENVPDKHPKVSISFVYFLLTLFLPVLLKNLKLIVESRMQLNNSVTESHIFLGVHEVQAGIIRMFMLLFTVLNIAHVAGCIFYVIARFEEEHAMSSIEYAPGSAHGSISWVFHLEMQDSTFGKRYIACLYWALVTITSTGYGDVVAVTVPERTYNIIVTLLGALIYATIFGRVTVMFNTMAQSKDLYRRRLAQVNRFMSVYDLPNDMRKRIRTQVKFDWALTSGINVDDVIQQLPYSMQVAVRREILQESLLQIPVMKDVSMEIITALCMFFQIRQCRAGSIIIQEGDPATEMYFVKTGSLNVIIHGKTIFRLSNGAIFGEAGLLFSKARTATIKAITRCVYFALSGEAYAQVTRMYPEFHELLESRAKLRLEDNDMRAVQQNRYSSRSSGYLKRKGSVSPRRSSFLPAVLGPLNETVNKENDSGGDEKIPDSEDKEEKLKKVKGGSEEDESEGVETKNRKKKKREKKGERDQDKTSEKKNLLMLDVMKQLESVQSKLDQILQDRKKERECDQLRAWQKGR
jgi:hypothetical protein